MKINKLLLFRYFILYRDFVISYYIFYKNSYTCNYSDKCIKEFSDRVLTLQIAVSTVPKRDLN